MKLNVYATRSLAVFFALLGTLALQGGGCLTPVGEGGSDPGRLVLIAGYFSFPIIYVTESGSSNFSNVLNPVSGTDITNATVEVTNVTTNVTTTCAHTKPTAPATNGHYTVAKDFPHTSGQKISLQVTSGSAVIKGSATTTSNQTYSNFSPSSGTVTRPFTISWQTGTVTQEASHTWVFLNHSSDVSKSYQVVVPLSQKSIEVTDKHIGAGTYFMSVFGINSMALSGAKSGSFIYIGSDTPGASSQAAVTVN